MPLELAGSCRCQAVAFRVMSSTPVPYQRCYCRICRKTQGGGGYAINLGADNRTLEVDGREHLSVYRAETETDGVCRTSTGERNFCLQCASALWLYDPAWPELVHPFASAIDAALPTPPSTVHLMLDFKPEWVVLQLGPEDRCFPRYPEESIADWHLARGLYVD